MENRSGGNQREITTMLPISMTPKPAPISARPVSSCGQFGASVNIVAPVDGEDQHADHGAARPETVEQEAAGDLHRGKAEEERTGQRPALPARSRRSRIRSSPMVTLAARKKWLAT